jgi:hypothetical protein
MFGLIAAAEAVLVACPATSNLKVRPGPRERAARRAKQRDMVIETVQHYKPEAVVVVGIP